MKDDRVSKRVLNLKPDDLRKPERPKFTWFDDVEEDLRTTSLKRRQIKTLKREEWSKSTREAKTKFKGPGC